MPRDLASKPPAEQDRRNRNAGDEKARGYHQSLIDELEAAISQRNIGSRAEILRQITDLFVVGSDHFDSEQMTLFDDVMRTSALLDESRGLEAKVIDTRLALEISVIQSLASQLLAILMIRDPLIDRVHLTKPEALAATVSGGGRAILRRLLRTVAPAQRYQTP